MQQQPTSMVPRRGQVATGHWGIEGQGGVAWLLVWLSLCGLVATATLQQVLSTLGYSGTIELFTQQPSAFFAKRLVVLQTPSQCMPTGAAQPGPGRLAAAVPGWRAQQRRDCCSGTQRARGGQRAVSPHSLGTHELAGAVLQPIRCGSAVCSLASSPLTMQQQPCFSPGIGKLALLYLNHLMVLQTSTHQVCGGWLAGCVQAV